MPWDAEKVSKLSTDAIKKLRANAERLGEIAEAEVNPKGMLSAEAETSRS